MLYANVYCKENGMWTRCSKGGEIYEKEKPRTVYRRFKRGDDILIQYENSQLEWCFEFSTLRDQLVVANSRERVCFGNKFWLPVLVHQTHNLSCIKFAHISRPVETVEGFVRLVKRSRSSPHETFHVATNATLNPDEKTTGATIGYNVCVANNNLCYNLRLPWREKKKERNSS